MSPLADECFLGMEAAVRAYVVRAPFADGKFWFRCLCRRLGSRTVFGLIARSLPARTPAGTSRALQSHCRRNHRVCGVRTCSYADPARIFGSERQETGWGSFSYRGL